MFNQDMFYLTQLIVNFGQEGKNVNVLEVRTKFHSAITRPNVVLNHPHLKGVKGCFSYTRARYQGDISEQNR